MSSQERALRVAQQQIGNQRMMKAMLDSELVTLRAEIERLKAIVDAIPGDDKQLVAEWAVTIAAEELLLRDACPNHDEGFTTAVLTCPPSVRAALRSVWGES